MMYFEDFKYALRLLAKKPGFTALTIVVMAVGLGLSTFLFSFLNTLVFNDLPFEDGDSIVQFSAKANGVRQFGEISIHDLQEIRESVAGLEEYSVFKNTSVNVSGRDGARRYVAKLVGPNFFDVTRVKPIHGRDFTSSENGENAERVAIISYSLWQNLYAGDVSVVDDIIRIDGESYRIKGIMPEGYAFPNNADLWMPIRVHAKSLLRSETVGVNAVAHLSDGFSIQDVNSQITLVMKRLEDRYPRTNSGVGAYVEHIPRTAVADGIAVVYAMQLVAILILALASINVGNLLLARAIERSKETAIRVALGAPRARLISQMLWESIIICVAGGLIAVALLAWSLAITKDVLSSFVVGKPMFWWNFGVDSYSLQILLMFVVGAVFITGFVPAWKNSGGDFNSVLRDGTRGAQSKSTGRLNRFLVIGEIFMSLTILIIAGVFTVGTFKATYADVGADTDNILTGRILLPQKDYPDEQSKSAFLLSLSSRLETSDNISEAMFASILPGEYNSEHLNFAIEDTEYTGEGSESYSKSNYITVKPGSLGKLGVKLRGGRYFNTGDEEFGNTTVIVTESFVERNFRDANPLGKRVRLQQGSDDGPWMTIVGVVEHTVHGQANQEAGKVPSVFRPYAQDPKASITIALKYNGNYFDAVETLRDTVRSLDSHLPVFNIESYQDSLDRYTAPLRFISSIFLIFGLSATLLAATGIYGVMANTINQKQQEVGVRCALGATKKDIFKEFLFRGLKQLFWGCGFGIVAGGAIGFAMTTAMGVDNSDLSAIVIILMSLVGGVVTFAIVKPTRRILELEPSDALRCE